jgi:hypothetical protein
MCLQESGAKGISTVKGPIPSPEHIAMEEALAMAKAMNPMLKEPFNATSYLGVRDYMTMMVKNAPKVMFGLPRT